MKRRRYITPGIAMPREVDGRTLPARRFRELVKAYAAEIGGELSVVDRELVRTAAAIGVRSEVLQAKIIAGEAISGDEAIRLASESRRILESIRSRSPKNKPDAPTELDRYLKDKYGPADSEDEPEVAS
jgi:hypothetical protein